MRANPGSPELQAFLSRLSNVKKQAGGFVARCPAHADDSRDTLSIADGNRAVVLWCWAGCDTRKVVEAAGCELKDLFYPDPFRNGNHAMPANGAVSTPKTQKRPDRRAVAIEAEMAAERLRGETELLAALRQRRGWSAHALYNLKVGYDGDRLTLPAYDKDNKLHDVLRYEAIKPVKRKILAGEGKSRIPWPRPEGIVPTPGWPLIVVEGEGTAISVASLGLAVVALPGSIRRPTGDLNSPSSFKGPGWHPSWARRLAGVSRKFLLVPDADESGVTLMRAVSYDMARMGGLDVRYLDLGLPEGQDIGDLLAVAKSGQSRAEAKMLLRAAYDCLRKSPEQVEGATEMLRTWRAYWEPRW